MFLGVLVWRDADLARFEADPLRPTAELGDLELWRRRRTECPKKKDEKE
jgi:hypothetical protein